MKGETKEGEGGYWLTHTKKAMWLNAGNGLKRNYLFINLMAKVI